MALWLVILLLVAVAGASAPASIYLYKRRNRRPSKPLETITGVSEQVVRGSFSSKRVARAVRDYLISKAKDQSLSYGEVTAELAELHRNLLGLTDTVPPALEYFRKLVSKEANNPKGRLIRKVGRSLYGLAPGAVSRLLAEGIEQQAIGRTQREATAVVAPMNKESIDESIVNTLEAKGQMGGPLALVETTSAEAPLEGTTTGQPRKGEQKTNPPSKIYTKLVDDLNISDEVVKHADQCWRARGNRIRLHNGDPFIYDPAAGKTVPLIRKIFVAITGDQLNRNLPAGCGLTGAARQCCVNPWKHDPNNEPIYVTIHDTNPHLLTAEGETVTEPKGTPAEERQRRTRQAKSHLLNFSLCGGAPVLKREDESHVAEDVAAISRIIHGQRGFFTSGVSASQIAEKIGLVGQEGRVEVALVVMIQHGKITLGPEGRYYPPNWLFTKKEHQTQFTVN